MPGDDVVKRTAALIASYKDKFEAKRRILTFDQYLALVAENPGRYCRDAATFVRDAFDHFGSYAVPRPWGEEKRFALFDAAFQDGRNRLVGQERAQREVYKLLSAFVHEGMVNRLVILTGPNGSAKSTFVTTLMAALEHYSTVDEGVLYTFNWVFPSQRPSSSTIGFQGEQTERRPDDSFALLPDEDVDAKLCCEVRDHPLLLLSPKMRGELFAGARGEEGTDGLRVPALIARGGLCHKCAQIFEALLSAYHGDMARVLQHVQVERWFISQAYRRGAVSIGPQMHVDAGERQISADRSLAALPSSLQMTTLFERHGELVDAAGGLLEYSDFLKRPLDAFRYLLSTIETGEVSLAQSILRLNTVLLATTNDAQMNAFREHPEYAAFRGRIAVVRMPYIRDYPTERQIYDMHIVPKLRRHVAPHATEVAARWAVLTRLRRPELEHFPDKVRSTLREMTVTDKAELYATGRPPAGLKGEVADEVRAVVPLLYEETEDEIEYEGSYGASPREIRSILLAAAQDSRSSCVSPLVVVDHVRALCGRKAEHDFLRRPSQPGSFDDHDEQVGAVRELLRDQVEEELRVACGLVAEESHLDLLERYVLHVRHWVKGEKLHNRVTGKDEDPDEALMTLVEHKLGVTDRDGSEFRRALISVVAGYAIEHPGAALGLAKVFPEHLAAIRESYYAENRARVADIGLTALALLAGDPVSSEVARATAATTIESLRTRFGYCDSCAKEVLADLLRARYRDSM